MARDLGSRCRLCRREKTKLFLKGIRCIGDKCAFSRRPFNPGMHGHRREKITNYALQLREKQKVKRLYGITEKQFRLYFKHAVRMKGITGECLLSLLERRLDNVICRVMFFASRALSRQIVGHRFIYVNGRVVDIPSYLVREGDKIAVKSEKKILEMVRQNIAEFKERGIDISDKLNWLKVNLERLEIEVLRLPTREDVQFPIEEQLIVELYSK